MRHAPMHRISALNDANKPINNRGVDALASQPYTHRWLQTSGPISRMMTASGAQQARYSIVR